MENCKKNEILLEFPFFMQHLILQENDSRILQSFKNIENLHASSLNKLQPLTWLIKKLAIQTCTDFIPAAVLIGRYVYGMIRFSKIC